MKYHLVMLFNMRLRDLIRIQKRSRQGLSAGSGAQSNADGAKCEDAEILRQLTKA